MDELHFWSQFNWKWGAQIGFVNKKIKFYYLSTFALIRFSLEWKMEEKIILEKTDVSFMRSVRTCSRIQRNRLSYLYLICLDRWRKDYSDSHYWVKKTHNLKEGFWWHFGGIHSLSYLARGTIACYSQNNSTQNKQNGKFHVDSLYSSANDFSRGSFLFIWSNFQCEIRLTFIEFKFYKLEMRNT